MSNFKKYSEIENTYRQKTINLIVEQGKSAGTWCVVEKAHGSNASFWTNDCVNFRPAKRTSFVEDDDNFNNIHQLLEENLEVLRWASEDIQKMFKEDVTEIIFYGEIIGGTYDHPDVPKNPQAIKVQKGVFYSPDNLFYLFDIKVNGSFMNHYTMSDLALKYKMLYAESIYEGDLEECIEFPNNGRSIISDNLDFPQIEGNIMEGTVIKPIIPVYFNNGSRVILKNKNEKFKEKANKSKRPKVKKEVNTTEEFNVAFEEAMLYITDNRLRNVISKFGDVNEKDFGKLCGMFTQDALKDYRMDNKELLEKLEKEEQKLLNKRMNNEAGNHMRKNFLNIIDKEF